ncbi:hypothetical protein GCM10022293_29040 [Azospirillum formosense]
MKDLFSGCFLFIFECAPSMLDALNELGIPFIDVRVHPVRFLGDLVLSFHSNVPSIRRRIEKFRLSRDFIAAEVNYTRGRFANLDTDVEEEAIVFFSQMSFDATTIHNGSFVTVGQHRETLRTLVGDRPTWIKPHPNEPDSRITREWMEVFPTSRVTHSNTYHLLARSRSLHIITISSSTGCEAEFFGHKATYLSPKNLGLASGFHENYTPVLFHYWHPEFWRFVFRDSPFQFDLGSHAFVPDRLRKVIGEQWSKTF